MQNNLWGNSSSASPRSSTIVYESMISFFLAITSHLISGNLIILFLNLPTLDDITFTRCFISLIKKDPIKKIFYSIKVVYPSQNSRVQITF
jgi:hypothetical protein